MSSAILASTTFSDDDQAAFARLSGDFNPMHTDPLAARRTQAGAVVVHGMHAVLWSLDRLIESGAASAGIAGIKVQFSKFIYVGSPVCLKILRRDEASIRAELALGDLTAVVLNLTLGSRKGTGAAPPPDVPRIAPGARPAELVRPGDAAGLCGALEIGDSAREIEARFPHAASALGSRRVAAMALLSRLVGMICPGLYSIFAAFAVDLVNASDTDTVDFSVSGTDERFRIVGMKVFGAGISGSVQAFLRWPPIAQAPLGQIMKVVAPREFAGSTALVVGGSRGLGCLTAKVIAAGGGKVVATYATGREEAELLAEEIGNLVSRDACRVAQYDVRRDAASQLEGIGAGITHLYYFASTSINRQKSAFFVADLFEEFLQVYVKGFYDCCRFLDERVTTNLTAFYPSSVFVEDTPPGMTEYGMAKAAGELLCASINRTHPRIRVLVDRLPRLLTDQTAVVPPVASADALEVMLPTIRRAQSFTRA
jgi:NADP-dependent 3-hydroxy acid dehydrogenase YdfG